ncbi:MAG: hypothetical protein ABJE95_17270 [Byssovorax sp.]
MRLWHCGLGFSLAVVVGLGCSAAPAKPPGTGGAGGGGSTSTATGAGGSGGAFTTGPGSGGSGGAESCATFSAAAKQASAAMLFVLDGTASMGQQGKWGTAQLAVVQAIDKNVFDTMSLGMLVFPNPQTVPGPDCIFNFPVACGVSGLPQVPMTLAGTDKSTAPTGIRHDIYQYLIAHGPDTMDASDSSPIYDALNSSYKYLKQVPNVDKRLVVLITDGGGSCTSVAVPSRPAYMDNNGCADWEQPPVLAKFINDTRLDPAAPINTFVVGVPGSNSHGEKQGSYDTPPYSMLLALSSYAVNGSPDTLDPACDQATAFTQAGTDPAKPCHIDLSNGANFNADALATAITTIRGKALGCLYNLPDPPAGKTIDLKLVNVGVTLAGAKATIPKRSNPADACAMDGCWDYTGMQQVQLIGKTCTDVTAAADAKVDITVGCATIIK